MCPVSIKCYVVLWIFVERKSICTKFISGVYIGSALYICTYFCVCKCFNTVTDVVELCHKAGSIWCKYYLAFFFFLLLLFLLLYTFRVRSSSQWKAISSTRRVAVIMSDVSLKHDFSYGCWTVKIILFYMSDRFYHVLFMCLL